MKNEVDSKEIVQKLLRGSANIDRMRKEIDQIVKINLHPIWCHMLDKFGEVKRVTSERSVLGTQWEITNSDQPGVLVMCHLLMHGCKNTVYVSNGSKNCSAVHVHLVHSGLPEFIKLLQTTFTNIPLDWRPLLDAADAFPE